MAPELRTPPAQQRHTPQKRRRVTTPDQEKPRANYDEIAARAYALFLQRGGVHGEDLRDWLLAEHQLTS